MKKILPFLFVLIGFSSAAQIVNIPDANFKNALLNYNPSIDLNQDGQIQVSEAAIVTHLDLFDNNIIDLTGITAFTSLTNLNCTHNNITSIDLTGLNNLYVLSLEENKLTTLNASGLTNLYALYCRDNLLTSLNVQNCTALNVLHFADWPGFSGGPGNEVTSIDLGTVPSLKFFTSDGNPLTSLDFSACPQIEQVTCRNNQLTSLNLSGHTTLTDVTCTDNLLNSINVNGCTALVYLDCQRNQLTNLDLSTCSHFRQLLCANNQITSLNITGLTTLTHFLANNNLLTAVDLSTNPGLGDLYLHNNQLTWLSIKNGPGQIGSIIISGNPNLQYVCADETEMVSIQATLAQQGLTNVNVNSYCSFTPGGTYNKINGSVRIDNNNNGCDASDPLIPELIMKINDGTNIGYTSSNSLGSYSFYTNTGNFTITPQTANPYFTITPASASINFATAGGNVQAANFCFAPNGVHNDLDITIIPISRARPGFDATYQLVYKNKGTSTLSGNVDLNFDDAKMNFLAATPVVTTQSTGSLSWVYSNLQPFETRTVDVRFNLLPPPTNNITDTLTFTGIINPLAGDETPIDNSFSMEQVVTGSFDPNDKTCLEGDSIAITRVGDYMHYLVRFQNTGTDVAENVVVKDVLANNFNWNSFEITKTSHPCVLKQTGGNKLEFIFEGINLPVVSVDEPGSHGFIAFKIKTIGTLVIGDTLKNNAAIYFDFNLPVITNTAASVIDSIKIVPISIEYFKGAIQAGKHLLNW